MKLASLFFSAVILFPGLARAEGSANTSGAFFKLGEGARPTAMGGTYMEIADDVQSLLWNPAGLTAMRDIELSASHLSYLMDVNDEFVAFGQPLYGMGAWACGLSYLYTEDVSRDNWGNPGATFTDFDFSAQVGYAMDFLPQFSGGIVYKILREGYASAFSMGSVFDAGLQYRGLFYPQLNVAMGAFNMGTPMAIGSNINYAPFILKAGASWALSPAWVLAAEYSHEPIDFINKFHFGSEYKFQTKYFGAAVRAGYVFGPEDNSLGGQTGLSAGAGLNWNGFQIDYSYVPYGDLGTAQRLSLSYFFGNQ